MNVESSARSDNSGEPAVCVLLASHNGAEFIYEQLKSLIAQEGVVVTILISDDGSVDNTLGIVGDFITQNALRPDQVYITSPSSHPLGASGNFLSLMEFCDPHSFDFIALADQDDVWSPRKLITAISHLQLSDAECYSSSVTAFWPNNTQRIISQSQRRSDLDFLFEGGGHGCTYVMTSAFLKDVNSFLIKHKNLTSQFYYHDWLLYILARTWGRKWVMHSESHILYRQHNNNDTGTRSSVKGVLLRMRKLNSGWYRAQIEYAIELHAAAALFFGIPIARQELLECLRSGGTISKSLVIMKYSRRRLADRVALIIACVLGRV